MHYIKTVIIINNKPFNIYSMQEEPLTLEENENENEDYKEITFEEYQAGIQEMLDNQEQRTQAQKEENLRKRKNIEEEIFEEEKVYES